MKINAEIKIKIRQATRQSWIECCDGGVADLSFPESKFRRGRVQDGGQICPTITRSSGALYKLNVVKNGEEYDVLVRKLTENEVFMLMGMTNDDCNKCKNVDVSKSSLYGCAGNGIVTNCVQLLMEHLYKAQYDHDFVCTDEKHAVE